MLPLVLLIAIFILHYFIHFYSWFVSLHTLPFLDFRFYAPPCLQFLGRCQFYYYYRQLPAFCHKILELLSEIYQKYGRTLLIRISRSYIYIYFLNWSQYAQLLIKFTGHAPSKDPQWKGSDDFSLHREYMAAWYKVHLYRLYFVADSQSSQVCGGTEIQFSSPILYWYINHTDDKWSSITFPMSTEIYRLCLNPADICAYFRTQVCEYQVVTWILQL